MLEKRLRQAVHARQATAATALAAVEDSLLYLDNPRLTDNLGARAVRLLAAERTVDDAPEVLRRIRRLLAYYRANQPGLPDWFQEFVTAGYAHYCTLLPTVCLDEQTTDIGWVTDIRIRPPGDEPVFFAERQFERE